MENIEQNDNIDCTKIRTTAELNEELLTAVYNNSLEQVKSLVEQGVDVNYKDEDDDWMPLMYAVMSSNLEIIKYLIDKGADVDAKDSQGNTPLMCAFVNESSNLEIMKYLIDKGADVNVKDSEGNTVLLYAINKGELNLVKLLIENGADIEVKDKFGYTALMIACGYNFEIAKFLIDNGADVNAKSESGRTPLVYCCGGHFFDNDEEVLELVKYLIERGADANVKDSDGDTALKYAIKYQNKEVVKFLISKNADVNAKYEYGETPLMLAANRANFEIAKLLIINGADVNAKDNDGKTALMYAKNVAMKNFLRETIKKQKFPQSDERIRTTESTISLMNVDYSDFNQLKSEVEKHHQAIIKTMDFSLALQKKISDLQEDSFLNAQYIQVIKNTHQMQIDKIYSILKKHIINTNNFIVEFAEKYDKENKQKGFIRSFFDKIAKNFGTISNSAEPNTSILKPQLSNETIPQNSSECQEQDDSGDESNESIHKRRKS